MTSEDRDLLIKRIEEELASTKEAIAEYREMSAPVAPENSIGRLSRMDAIQNKSVTEATLRQAEYKLSRLEQIQVRISDADFGICVRCKQPIPIGRLMLMPHSTRCVQCSG